MSFPFHPTFSLHHRHPLQSRAINTARYQQSPISTNSTTITTTNSTNSIMSSAASATHMVTIFLKRPSDNERQAINTMPRSTLEAHSTSFRAFLAANPVPNEFHREITLPQGAPGALRHVLNIIKTHGHHPGLFINIAGLEFTKVVAIWQACQIINLQPDLAFERVTKHIMYVLSQ
jgi:hypothetical protein